MSAFWKTTFKIALWVGGLALIVGGVLRIFFVTPITPGHDGMAPTFLAEEKVLLWRDGAIDMADIVVCEHPRAPGSMVIGRVVAKGGMTLGVDERGNFLVEGSRITVNSQEELSFYDSGLSREVPVRRGVETIGNSEHEIFLRDGFRMRLSETSVPAGKLFLLGDNRGDRTHDSRTFGPVDASTCVGTIVMRWNPESRGDALGHGWLDLIR